MAEGIGDEANAVQQPARRDLRLFDGPFGGAYAFYMEHEALSRVIARVMWGGDTRPFYAGMEAIATAPAGALVVDAPCGAGVAFRGLAPGQDVRYIAVDLSARMLLRAQATAARRRLAQVELVRADASAVPVEDGTAELFLSHFGLHCFPRPAAAVREIARCLRPGGRVIGSTIASGPRLRQRLLVHPGFGAFGAVGTTDDLRRWLDDAGFEHVRIDESGCFAFFDARAPTSAGPPDE
jgi:SAM-dependent methyltransferase